jgi:hypothetical protein
MTLPVFCIFCSGCIGRLRFASRKQGIMTAAHGQSRVCIYFGGETEGGDESLPSMAAAISGHPPKQALLQM